MTETELVQRLERLERAHRRLKGFALVALILATALATIYATQPVPQKITAHEFVVVDDSGNVRVRIVATQGTPGIFFYDARRVVRAAMVLDQKGWDFALGDTEGKPHMSLDVTAEGVPTLTLFDSKGGAQMGIAPSGSPRITLTDANGFEMDLGSTSTVKTKTGATEQSSAASIVMFGNDEKGHVIWQAP